MPRASVKRIGESHPFTCLVPLFLTPTSNAHIGAISLANEVKRIGESHPFTCLVPDMSGGIDPDDVFSRVPYEKGFWFLYYLQV